MILVRSAESIGNLGGTLTGWSDVKLSDFGRRQAFTLSSSLTQFRFPFVFSSDLDRCKQTAFYALAFPNQDSILISSKLREINFGKDEGIHFDSLKQSDKERINSPDYKAEQGESWTDVQNRFIEFCKLAVQRNAEYNLVFTHGGLMCSILRKYGEEQVLNNCSVAGVVLDELSKVKSLEFVWKFPVVDEF